ncbi:hypothetical protein ACWPO0_03850 [Acinetobacter nosocomialis]|uniref:hypothetical protein n=2 Tax=Acinetobacter nosocomialis TaxID=106654 RepID=UPI0010935C41|nr:hypothetical protein [Acinetobacter nosocomialis]MCU4551006.1 hypothetical protein [Acinetobacter nosocomialis]QCA00219.1 hypothetical protein KAN01_06000 [Acinetobacter nosocomialis]
MEKLLSGEILIFMDSLDLVQGDDEMLNSIMLIGTSFKYDESNFEDSSYYRFFKGGVEYLFEEKKLSAIFFFINPNDEYNSYLRKEYLIDGLSPSAKKVDVTKVFGLPDFSGTNWIKYKIDNHKYIHFEFDQEVKLKKITLGLFD